MTTGRGPGGTGASGRRRTLHTVGLPSSRTLPIAGLAAPRAAPPADGTPAPMDAHRTRAEGFTPEDDVLARARARSADRGVVPVGAAATAALGFLAAAVRARAVVEIGTGLGVSAVGLLRGMPPEGLLTTIDVDAEHQRLARLACGEAGYEPSRVRTITGRALDVLPRLSDAGYDLVCVDAVTTEYPRYLAEAIRLLRPGGVVALEGVLWNGRLADPVRHDAVVSALRETARAAREDERLVPVMLPVSEGLLCAARR